MSHATSSGFVPLPSPPLENSELGVLLVSVNVVMSFLLCDLVILPEPVGSPPGSPLAGLVFDPCRSVGVVFL